MNCPVCKEIKLVISDRQGIEIDYCTSCGGMWLELDELDKIIDRNLPPQLKFISMIHREPLGDVNYFKPKRKKLFK